MPGSRKVHSRDGPSLSRLESMTAIDGPIRFMVRIRGRKNFVGPPIVKLYAGSSCTRRTVAYSEIGAKNRNGGT